MLHTLCNTQYSVMWAAKQHDWTQVLLLLPMHPAMTIAHPPTVPTNHEHSELVAEYMPSE